MDYYDAQCPYCGTHQDINHDDGYGYEEDQTFNQECVSCDKTFAYLTHIHFTYDVEKAPCLNNDGEHDWRDQRAMSSHGPGSYKRCRTCGERTEYIWDEPTEDE